MADYDYGYMDHSAMFGPGSANHSFYEDADLQGLLLPAEGHGHLGDEAGYYDLFEFDTLPEELSGTARTAFSVVYTVVMVLGLGGNTMTALVVGLHRDMWTVTNVFLVSLAASDALIAAVNMPLQLRSLLLNEWTIGSASCKLSAYIQGVVIVASIFTLTALAIDRLYAICQPLRARHVHTTRRAMALVVIIWITSLVILSPQLVVQRLEPLLVLHMDSLHHNQPQPDIRIAQMCVEYFSEHQYGIAYTLFFYVVLYLIPVLTMFLTYGRIAVTLWRRRPIGDSPDTLADSVRRLKEKKRIVCMLVLIVVLFTVSWFPFFTAEVYLHLMAGHDARRNSSTRTVIAALQLLGYSNCCVNPIIYCFVNDSYQRHLARTVRCQCSVRRQQRVRRARQLANAAAAADAACRTTSRLQRTGLQRLRAASDDVVDMDRLRCDADDGIGSPAGSTGVTQLAQLHSTVV